MSGRDENAWVFDSIVGFLQGPIWTAPLLNFIEQKSLIFEPDTDDCEGYRVIYQEYKNLVDMLLSCYMEDIGITPWQFEQACTTNKDTKLPVKFQQGLFEQIWAANEYKIFKSMMIQKNLELQNQVINMIEMNHGITPPSLISDPDGGPEAELTREELLTSRCEIAFAIAELQLKAREDSVPEIKEDHEEKVLEEKKTLPVNHENEKLLLEEAASNASTIVSSSSTRASRSPSPRSQEPDRPKDVPMENKKPIETPVPEKKKKQKILQFKDVDSPLSTPATSEEQPTNLLPKTKAYSVEEFKRREKYLKARRDKLVAMKKEARSKTLETADVRPGTAKIAATAAVHGDPDYENSQISEPSILKVRKALAARLKAEVVDL